MRPFRGHAGEGIQQPRQVLVLHQAADEEQQGLEGRVCLPVRGGRGVFLPKGGHGVSGGLRHFHAVVDDGKARHRQPHLAGCVFGPFPGIGDDALRALAGPVLHPPLIGAVPLIGAAHRGDERGALGSRQQAGGNGAPQFGRERIAVQHVRCPLPDGLPQLPDELGVHAPTLVHAQGLDAGCVQPVHQERGLDEIQHHAFDAALLQTHRQLHDLPLAATHFHLVGHQHHAQGR